MPLPKERWCGLYENDDFDHEVHLKPFKRRINLWGEMK